MSQVAPNQDEYFDILKRSYDRLTTDFIVLSEEKRYNTSYIATLSMFSRHKHKRAGNRWMIKEITTNLSILIKPRESLSLKPVAKISSKKTLLRTKNSSENMLRGSMRNRSKQLTSRDSSTLKKTELHLWSSKLIICLISKKITRFLSWRQWIRSRTTSSRLIRSLRTWRMKKWWWKASTGSSMKKQSWSKTSFFR